MQYQVSNPCRSVNQLESFNRVRYTPSTKQRTLIINICIIFVRFCLILRNKRERGRIVKDSQSICQNKTYCDQI